VLLPTLLGFEADDEIEELLTEEGVGGLDFCCDEGVSFSSVETSDEVMDWCVMIISESSGSKTLAVVGGGP
jgi:hypothetical protein